MQAAKECFCRVACSVAHTALQSVKPPSFPLQCLRPGVGQAWIAAKSYYFGVGGGTAAFKTLLATDGTFKSRLAAVIDEGASNKRENLVQPHASGKGIDR